jgi:hypothetical protein
MAVTTNSSQTKGFTLEQVSALFGDEVVDMHGEVEKSAAFLKRHHDVDKLEEVAWEEQATVPVEKSHDGLV